MNCQSVKNLLPAFYLADVAPHQRQAVERHLISCTDCQASLANLSAIDQHFQAAVTRQMDHLTPPSNTWKRIQAKMITRNQKPATNLRLVWLALAAAVIIVLSTLAVPPVNARLEEIARRWLLIQVPSSGTTVTIADFQAFTPWIPSSLPAGFDLTTTGIHTRSDSEELQLTYSSGADVFLLVQTNQNSSPSLPDGKTVDLGTVEGKLIDPAGVVEEQYRTAFISGSIRLLIWEQDGILISLYSNMPVENMLQFARSMGPLQK